DFLLPARDVVEDELRDVGVVADHDEHRRSAALGARIHVSLPWFEVLLAVVFVQAVQRAFEFGGQLGLASYGFGAAPFTWQVIANAEPKVAIGWLVAN